MVCFKVFSFLRKNSAPALARGGRFAGLAYGAELSPRGRRLVPAVLVLCTATNILATDFYAPSMNHLPEVFQVPPSDIYLTMSLYFATACFMQLVYGPLSERFGRRRLLLLGYAGFILSSLVAALASFFGVFLGARIAQAACGSAVAVTVVPTIRALFDEKDSLKIMGYFGLAVGLAPAIGPVAGGFVHVWWGWRMVFFLLAGFALLAWLAVLRLVPETVDTKHAPRLSAGRALGGYLALIRNRASLAVVLPATFGFGGLFAFVSAGPFVFIGTMGVATEHYGFLFMTMVFSFMSGSFTLSRLAGRGYAAGRLFRAACLLMPFAGLIALVPVAVGIETAVSLLFGVCVFAFLLGFLIATAPLALIATLPDGVGSGPAIGFLYSMQFGGAGMAIGATGHFHNGTALPFALTLATFASLATVATLLCGKSTAP